MKITLRNNFHNTTVNVQIDTDGYLTTRQVKRARATLCGIKECTCGDELGQRGPQDWPVIPVYGVHTGSIMARVRNYIGV